MKEIALYGEVSPVSSIQLLVPVPASQSIWNDDIITWEDLPPRSSSEVGASQFT